jgi:serine phosphatase RsbU (regulator of sigma subunit)/CHASE1-domain containing sensor protein/anti-sigma regulatory factor (Ser/Thr protein kinase)
VIGAVVLLVGLGSAGVIWLQEERTAQARTDATLRSVGDATTRFVQSSLAAMSGAGATLDPTGRVDPARLEAFSANLSRVSPVNATASVSVVPAEERAAFETAAGRPILDLDGTGVAVADDRDEYWVVDQVVPANETIASLIGLDIAANPISGDPARAARDDGRTKITQAIKVPAELAGVEGGDDDELSIFFVIKPIYELDAPVGTVAERRAAHRGFVASALTGTQLADDLASVVPDDVDVRVTDGDVVVAGSPRPAGGAVSAEQTAAGRRWIVQVDDRRGVDHALPLVILVVTLVLLSGLTVAVRRDRRHERHRRRVDDMLARTAELARRLSAAASVEQIEQVIADGLPAALGARSARLRLRDLDQDPDDGADDRSGDPSTPSRLSLDPFGTTLSAVVDVEWSDPTRIDELTSSTITTVTELCEQSLARAAATDRATQQAGALAELAEQLAAAADVDTVLSTVLGSARGPVRASAVSIGLIDDDGLRLLVRHGETVDDAVGERYAGPLLSEPLAFTDAARTGLPVLIPDLGEYQRRYPDTDGSHVRLGAGARAAMPLLVDGGPIGSVVFAWDRDHRFDDELLFSLSTIAELTAQAVQRARLTAMHLHDAERSRALADLAQGLATCDDQEQLGVYVVDHLGTATGADLCALLVDDGMRWRCWSSSTLADRPELCTHLVGPDAVPSGRLREVALGGDTATSELDDGAYVALRHRSGEPLGAIWLGWSDGRPRDDEHDDVVSTVGGMVEQSVGRAVSADQLRVDWDRSERLAEFARRLAGVHTVEDLVHAVMAHAHEPAGAVVANIGLLDESGTELQVVPHQFFDAGTQDAFSLRRRSDQLPGTDAIRSGAPVLLHTRAEVLEQYPGRVAEAVQRHGLHASAHFPMIGADGQALGCIGFAWNSEQRFRPAKLARLRTLAELCTQTLQRARLGDAEHRLVDSLHHRVVGRTPRFADLALATRYLPSTHEVGMGGDWYDALTLDDHSFAVIVGDVAGHGISAVADMLELRAVIRALLQHDVPLEQVFELVSSSWLEGNDSLATACISVIDTRTDVVRHVSAGHIPAMVRLPDGTVVALDGGRQPVLGVPGRTVIPHEERFPPGSVLVMCTDGLIERRTRQIDESIDALAAAVGELGGGADIDEMSDAILDRCLSDTEQQDDVALVVVRKDLVDELPSIPSPATTRHERRFDPSPAAVSSAREFSTGAAGVSGPARDDVALITSELVTNAALHGTGDVVVRVERGVGHVRIAVFDDAPQQPSRQHPAPTSETGRGLGIVEMIASGWGVTEDGTGKWVWADVRVDDPA